MDASHRGSRAPASMETRFFLLNFSSLFIPDALGTALRSEVISVSSDPLQAHPVAGMGLWTQLLEARGRCTWLSPHQGGWLWAPFMVDLEGGERRECHGRSTGCHHRKDVETEDRPMPTRQWLLTEPWSHLVIHLGVEVLALVSGFSSVFLTGSSEGRSCCFFHLGHYRGPWAARTFCVVTCRPQCLHPYEVHH